MQRNSNSKAWIALLQDKNVVWIYNQHSMNSHEECIELFDVIESMVIEKNTKII